MEQIPEITIEQILQNSYQEKDPSQITKLNLSSQSYQKINKIINDQVQNLKTLNLSYNNIETLENLNNLPQLQDLAIHHNKISEIKQLNQNTQLQNLNLNNNCVDNMKLLPNLPKLQTLKLNSNRIQSLQGMESYRELKELYLSNNHLKNIKFLPSLPKIQEFYISNNQIESLSTKIFENLKNLLILDLSGNKLKTLDFLEPLQENLEKLYAKENQIEQVPTHLKFENLDFLDLSHNKINVIQDFDLIFPALITLDMSYNEIYLFEDIDVLEYMNFVVEVNFKGNLCSKNEEQFIEETRKKFELIQVINGFEVHDPGFRYKEMMRELEEDMDMKREKYGEQYDQGDENFNKIIQMYSKEIEKIRGAGEELDAIRKNMVFQQIQNEYDGPNNENQNKQKLKEFEDEAEYTSFMTEYQREMSNIKQRYDVIVDFSKNKKKQLRSKSLDNIDEQQNDQEDNDDQDNNKFNSDYQDNEDNNINDEDMDQEYLEQLEKENILQENQSDIQQQQFEQQQDQDNNNYQYNQKFKTMSFMKKNEIPYMTKNLQNLRISSQKKLNTTTTTSSSNRKGGEGKHQVNKIQKNNEKIMKSLGSKNKSNNNNNNNNNIIDEINQVKQQMQDPMFLKTIGSTNEFGNLGVLHEGLMGQVTLKPKLPFAPKKSTQSTQQQQQNKFRQTDMGKYGSQQQQQQIRGNSTKQKRPSVKKGNLVTTPLKRSQRSNSNNFNNNSSTDQNLLDSTNNSTIKSQKQKAQLQNEQYMQGSSSKIKTKLLTALNYKK